MNTLSMATLAAMFLVVAVAAEGADGPNIEFSGTYSRLDFRDEGISPATRTSPAGFAVGVTLGVRDWLSIASEVGGDYQSQHSLDLPSETFRVGTYALLGGPRFASNATQRLTVFGQILIGVVHSRGTLSNSLASAYVGSPGNVSAASNALAWQPGAGADVRLSPHWALRFEADYRVTSVVGSPARVAFRQPRFSSGIVFTR